MSRTVRTLLLSACLFGFALPPTASTQTQSPSQTPAAYVCPMHPAVTSHAPGSCPQCKMKLVAKAAAKSAPQSETGPPSNWASLSAAERARALELLAPTYEHTCPMHPEVRQAQEGVCPKCGMPLRSLNPSVRGNYRLDMTATPARPKANERVRLRFVVTHPQTAAPVKSFVLNHERLFHLFVISRDLREYQHIHPQLDADGSFTVETALPREGSYKLHSDFFPAGGTPQLVHQELATANHRSTPRHVAPAAVILTPDTTLTKALDGMHISLELGANDGAPAAGVIVPLKFRLADARTGAPVRDLEPYLGAWGHTLILNADQSHYLHSHPTEMLSDGYDPARSRGGPEVEFKAMFPEAGDYRIWTQFQRAGRVTTVS
ncbi:MAG TPA: heavy metal-binding domain-containing protein, partial [Pyrinomonadaceae bacterium]